MSERWSTPIRPRNRCRSPTAWASDAEAWDTWRAREAHRHTGSRRTRSRTPIRAGIPTELDHRRSTGPEAMRQSPEHAGQADQWSGLKPCHRRLGTCRRSTRHPSGPAAPTHRPRCASIHQSTLSSIREKRTGGMWADGAHSSSIVNLAAIPSSQTGRVTSHGKCEMPIPRGKQGNDTPLFAA